MNHDLLDDSAWRGPLLLAMQRAILTEFTAADWREIGYETGFQDYITKHPRLLRSLSWNDADYSNHVFAVLEHFSRQDIQALVAVIQHPKIRPHLERDQPGKLISMGYQAGHVPPVAQHISASEAVRLALADADNLLATSGAPSTIDRLHTAMHGYLKTMCQESGIELPDGATLTVAYKALRAQHPALQSLGNHDGDIGKILAPFAAVLDAINTLRNHGSIAHPNESIVGTPEAALVVNAVRTMFHYLNQKLRPSS
ncbi:abortive infection family protein [Comamonas sp. Z1]|uniref:abortive infection family protein n=1 Tax=Comamonas sp. Z1 TaxID=2601246 RepID=UPI00165340D8|nr:abortive infection family protein [Comamonas sp. Z1]